jgi:hypothetical protein
MEGYLAQHSFVHDEDGGTKKRGRDDDDGNSLHERNDDGREFDSRLDIEHPSNDGEHDEEPSDFEAIGHDLSLLLDEKLDSTRFWAKKIVQETTTFVKALGEVEDEYRRIQDLEHIESKRLDQVEPEVEEAVGQLLLHGP